MGGFRTRFEKTLPQVVMAPYFYEIVLLTRASSFLPEDYEHNNPSLHVLDPTRGGDTLWGLNTETDFTAPQLKPCFPLFQRVWDQLYLTPPSLEGHTSLSTAYLGALGFTKPLEKLVLHGVPLQSLLEWLSKPKGHHLVEASAAAMPA